MSACDDTRHMAHALRLAARGLGRTHPNPVVGCVLTRQGQVVGQGWHRRAGLPHAEVEALRHAGDGRDCTAYVTLEPCSHHGRTPPCADALIQAGVRRVVAAMKDPNPLVAGRGLACLQEAGVAVTLGVMEEQAQALNRPFVTWVTRQRPLVTLKAATSLDGKIATRTGESHWITGTAARQKVQRLRDTHDAVMVGIGTVLADDPQLNCRMKGGRDPIRVVVDSRLRIPERARVFHASLAAPLWLAVCQEQAARQPDRVVALQNRPGVELLFCRQDGQGRVLLADLMGQLARRGVTSVLSEAGGQLTSSLLEQNLADRLVLFLAPRLIGGAAATGMLQGQGVARLADTPRLTAMTWQRLGDDFMLTGDLLPGEGRGCLPA